MSAIDQLLALLQGTPATYADYLKRTIITTVLDIPDEKLLNYIYTLLMTTKSQETQEEVF